MSLSDEHDLNRRAESSEDESIEVIDGIPIHCTATAQHCIPAGKKKDKHVGRRLAVWWRSDGMWRHGEVINVRRVGFPLLHLVRYDHGGIEWVDLATETVAFQPSHRRTSGPVEQAGPLPTAPAFSDSMAPEDLGTRCFELLAACRRGDTPLVEELLARDDCPKPVEALLEAIAWSHVEVVRLLIKAGCSTDGRGTVLCPAGVGVPYSETRDVTVFELSQRLQGTGTRRALQIALMLRQRSTDSEGNAPSTRRASVRQHRAASRFVATPAPPPRALKAAAASRLCNDLPSDLCSDPKLSDEVRHGPKRRHLSELSSRPKLARRQWSVGCGLSCSASESEIGNPEPLSSEIDSQSSPRSSTEATVPAAEEAIIVAQEVARSASAYASHLATLVRPQQASQEQYTVEAEPVPLVVARPAHPFETHVNERHMSTIRQMLAALEQKEAERRQQHDTLTLYLRGLLEGIAPQ